MTTGMCKLTGKPGDFVDSHLIPKALTRPEKPGLPFVQSGWDRAPSRRWSSWYDPELVIREGEDTLAAFDSWAIPTLRNYKMIWSGWGPLQTLLTADHKMMGDSGFGIHDVRGIDGSKLRLFFLSLLWRAAASTRFEVAEIQVPDEDLERLRVMLLNNDPGPQSFYPVTLTQLSTLGPVHNLTPIADEKITPEISDLPSRTIPFFRFYFEGLIAHIHRNVPGVDSSEGLGNLLVGYSDELTISTVTYEMSFQRKNLEYIMGDAHARWPNLMRKL